MCAFATPQDNRTARQSNSNPIVVTDDDVVPDSAAKVRWKVKRTAPLTSDDIDSIAIDLKNPENIEQTTEYNDSTGLYYIGTKIGSSYLNTPILLTPDEYRK